MTDFVATKSETKHPRNPTAYELGLEHGAARDLDEDFLEEALKQTEGWDEATINGVGSSTFAAECGLTPEEDEDRGAAWRQACADYNAGVVEGLRQRSPILYGIENRVYFANDNISDTYFLSREVRDKTLQELREIAVEHGLNRSSARSGICPFSVHSPAAADSLSVLCATVKHLARASKRDSVPAQLDPSAWPTFGGDEPKDTSGIYSWNATHVMVPGTGGDEAWVLVPRSE